MVPAVAYLFPVRGRGKLLDFLLGPGNDQFGATRLFPVLSLIEAAQSAVLLHCVARRSRDIKLHVDGAVADESVVVTSVESKWMFVS